MVRIIGGVIVGYLVIFAFVFLSFSGAYHLMGADFAFQPGSYDVSTTWIALSFAIGLIAAFLGGWVCVLVARQALAGLVLAGLLLVLGMAMAIPALTRSAPPPAPRTEAVDNFTAMQHARTPGWIAMLNPFVGAAGVLLGRELANRKQAGRPRPGAGPAPG